MTLFLLTPGSGRVADLKMNPRNKMEQEIVERELSSLMEKTLELEDVVNSFTRSRED